MDTWIWILLIGVLAVAVLLWLRQRSASATSDAEGSRTRTQEALDTVAAWPPEVTRVLSGQERLAHQAVVNALPEYLVLAQVPLARFLRVPRRHSYTEWLTRVGHLCADLLVCDKSSLATAVVIIRSPQDSERGKRRHDRIKKVLNSAKLKVVFWNEGAIPERQGIRDALLPSPQTPLTPKVAPIPTATVIEMHDDGPDTMPQHEPPSSTWFDDPASQPAPLDPAQSRS